MMKRHFSRNSRVSHLIIASIFHAHFQPVSLPPNPEPQPSAHARNAIIDRRTLRLHRHKLKLKQQQQQQTSLKKSLLLHFSQHINFNSFKIVRDLAIVALIKSAAAAAKPNSHKLDTRRLGKEKKRSEGENPKTFCIQQQGRERKHHQRGQLSGWESDY